MPTTPPDNEKIIYLTAGAGGMFCGSCMHDNALSRALSEHGWDIQLVPTYTPIRTDEENVSIDRVMFGGQRLFTTKDPTASTLARVLRPVPRFALADSQSHFQSDGNERQDAR